MTEQIEDDDNGLLALAASWARLSNGGDHGERQNATDETTQQKIAIAENYAATHSNERDTGFSLHITQLSYEATDYDIRDLFISKGCLVTSVRLVYRPDEKTGARKFTGVAFVDVSDEKSFKNGLELHRKNHLGRKINVRPTRSKEELSQIVEKTKETVSVIKQSSKIGGLPTGEISNTRKRNIKGTIKQKAHGSPTKTSDKGLRSRGTRQKLKGHEVRKARSKEPTKRKLTKQDRNRRAAILLARKNGSK